jgi:ABC-2 type transport system ATP-binding protein
VAVRGLTKRFCDRIAVDHLDLDLPRGVVAGFVGPNGAGKTTTMAMLLGLVRPTAGTATVLGCDISSPAAYLGRVGALIEGPAFYPSLTGVENLRMRATVGGTAVAQVPQLLEQVGLAGRGDDRYRDYSLGMKQRLGIAAALPGDPELLILDEPANGLDPQGVREIRELVGRLADAGRTVLVSSHDLSELEQICGWLLLIDTGRSLYQGPTAGLLDGAAGGLVVRPDPSVGERVRERLRAVLVGAGHEVLATSPDGRLTVGFGDRDPLDVAASVNRAAFAAGVVLVELAPRRTTLEERYLALLHGAPVGLADVEAPR